MNNVQDDSYSYEAIGDAQAHKIRLEAVRRLENLQNALISRKFPQIQITVKKTVTPMLIKMLICRSGFWQEKLPECPLETFLNVEHLIRVCRLQSCSVRTDQTQTRSVLATSVSLYIDIYIYIHIYMLKNKVMPCLV